MLDGGKGGKAQGCTPLRQWRRTGGQGGNRLSRFASDPHLDCCRHARMRAFRHKWRGPAVQRGARLPPVVPQDDPQPLPLARRPTGAKLPARRQAEGCGDERRCLGEPGDEGLLPRGGGDEDRGFDRRKRLAGLAEAGEAGVAAAGGGEEGEKGRNGESQWWCCVNATSGKSQTLLLIARRTPMARAPFRRDCSHHGILRCGQVRF